MAKVGFYVTVQRAAACGGVKTGWILGPYPNKAAAEGHVARARNVACEVDPRCSFDAFGVSQIELFTDPAIELPPGVLNDRIELEGEIGL